MFGGSGKRAFERTQIPWPERVIGAFILVLLAGIGVGVYLKGRSFDPGLFALDPQLLSSGKPARIPAPLAAEEGEDAAGRRAASAEPVRTSTPALPATPAPAASWWADLAPLGWRQQGEAERFPADDLYVKINGRAEQYLAYAVVGLECVGLADAAGRFIDIFVYDMGVPIRAFGIFSVERPPEAAALALGREGYQSGASFFFWQGRHYVQVVAGAEGADLEQAGLELARKLASRLEDEGGTLWGREVLPVAGQVPGSLQYFMRDALSLDFLGETFVARYRDQGVELTVFVSQQETIKQAGQVLGAYAEYLKGYGTVEEGRTEGGVGLVLGELGGFHDVVFSAGRYVAGVSQAEDRELARRWAENLARQLGKP